MNSTNKVSNINNSSSGKKMFGLTLGFIFVILFLYFIYTQIKGYKTYKNESPYFVKDIIEGSTAMTIPANRVPQSSDTNYGSEYTYSFWLFIKDTNFQRGNPSSCDTAGDGPAFKHIFHKGSYDFYQSQDGSKYHYPLLQSPGVWLYPGTNKLNIRFNTFDNIVETADIGNIPLNMWVNIIIILIGNSVDVYVNGNLKKRTKLNGVPKLNYGDLYITNWLGFDGYMSRFRYYNYAIQPFQIDDIFKYGASTKIAEGNNTLSQPSPNLSPNYWLSTGYPQSSYPNNG